MGNLGGLDSSIEITALGSPVNFLSRLDDLTKEPSIAELLNSGDIIACDDTVKALRTLRVDLDSEVIDLGCLGLSVRDFPETRRIHRIEPSDSNYQIALRAYRCLTNEKEDRGSIDDNLLARPV